VAVVTASAQTRFVGSGQDQVTASVRGADGLVYVTGVTNSPDFPATIEPVSRPTAQEYRPFVAKLSARGEVIYSTLLDAPGASARWMAVNAKGEVLISGQSVELGAVQFPLTPGAVGDGGANTGFLLKLDATGAKVLVGIRGYGQGPVAYDADDNIYVAGAAYGENRIGPTPGAFQATHESRACGGSGFLGIGCFYQYVAKISPDGTKLLYSTFLTGSYGAQAAGLMVDGAGNALVAGRTNSPDYPVTAGSFQPDYRAANPPPPPSSFRPSLTPPPVSGYVTKLNATGTGLLWSTYLSGTGADEVSRLQLMPNGDLFLTGASASYDLPASRGLPRACPLSLYPEIPFIAQLKSDGNSLMGSQYVYLDAYAPVTVRARPDGTAEMIEGAWPELNTVAAPYICLVDSADNSRLEQVAPGQLVTLFGDDLGGVTKVTFGGLAGTLLYTSANQINVRVPEELSRGGVLQAVGARANTRPVGFVERAPSVFLDLTRPVTALATCRGSSFSPGYAAVMRNEDGSLNSCENPAVRGSVVTVFLNGLGQSAPVVTLESGGGAKVVAVEPDPDSPSGVWRMRVQLAPNAGSGSITPVIDGARLRYGYLAVWVAP
jgi:uncharacterized protein (TIGR03437 family)